MICPATITDNRLLAPDTRFLRPLGSATLPLPGMTQLILAIIGLSAFDLVATLWCMKTVGMYEMNPIVRALADSTFPCVAISIFKSISVAGSVLPLQMLRARRSARIAAWIMVSVLSVLAVRWIWYAAASTEVTEAVTTVLAAGDESWIKL